MLIDLENSVPIANGNRREIFEHPHAEDELIKVYQLRRQRKEAARGFMERLYKPSYSWEFMREIKMVYRIARRAPAGIARLPVVQSLGLVRTTRGMGLAVEKIRDSEGKIAPTLRQMMRSGIFTSEHLDRLNAFIRQAFDLRIVAHDLHAENIVWDAKTECFVAVDGFGERTLIPIHFWSKRANDHQLNDTFSRHLGKVPELTWDPKLRQMRMA